MAVPLLEGIVYGPIASRRWGRSLGVDLTPSPSRVCSFDCLYCEFGARPAVARGTRWPAPGEVGSALANALPGCGPLDSITLSGHGEPTLHPLFGSVVAEVLSTSRRVSPGVPVRALTNGSQLCHEDVRRALDLLDERVVKLDADAERVCRPQGASRLDSVVTGLARLRDVTLQSCFFEGANANTGDASVSEWVELVSEIRPTNVQIYTISRPAAEPGVLPASPGRLLEVAQKLQQHSGIGAQVFA